MARRPFSTACSKALFEIDGVTDAEVNINRKLVTENGVPAKSIEAIGEDVVNDPSGERLKLRYAALSRSLTSKYGPGVSRHEVQEPWTRRNDFLTGIYRGSSHHYTDFSGQNVSIRLAIRASRRGVSNYVLIFQHVMPKPGNGAVPEKDVL